MIRSHFFLLVSLIATFRATERCSSKIIKNPATTRYLHGLIPPTLPVEIQIRVAWYNRKVSA